MVASLAVIIQPFGIALAALIAGPIYMLLRAKVAKPGGIVLFGFLFALVMFITGGGWPMTIAIAIGAVLAELVSRIGSYKSFSWSTVGYAIFMVATAIGSYAPLLIMKEYYLELAMGNSVDGSFMVELMNFISGPVLAGSFVVTILCAVLGAFLSRSMFKKHFVKAGIIKEGV